MLLPRCCRLRRRGRRRRRLRSRRRLFARAPACFASLGRGRFVAGARGFAAASAAEAPPRADASSRAWTRHAALIDGALSPVGAWYVL